MATPTGRARCVKCEKERIAYKCEGCLDYFCLIHLIEHHQLLGKELEEIENKPLLHLKNIEMHHYQRVL